MKKYWMCRLALLISGLSLILPGCQSAGTSSDPQLTVTDLTRTQLWIKNPTQDTLEVFVVLAALGGACDASNPPVTADTLKELGWCDNVINSAHPPYAGKCSRWILPNDSVQFPDLPNTCISGNVTYRAFPACPDSVFPLGYTTAEFTLNVISGPEVIDISMVNGFSDVVKMGMDGGGAWTVESSGATIASIQNFPIDSIVPTVDSNIGNPGVYPINCTDCIRLVDSIVCPGFARTPSCQATRICNIQRDVSQNGGRVVISMVPPSIN